MDNQTDPYTGKKKRRPTTKPEAEAQHEEHLSAPILERARAKLAQRHTVDRAALNKIGSW